MILWMLDRVKEMLYPVASKKNISGYDPNFQILWDKFKKQNLRSHVVKTCDNILDNYSVKREEHFRLKRWLRG